MSRTTRAATWYVGVLGMVLVPALTPATVGDADPGRGPGVVAEQEETELPPGFAAEPADRPEGLRAPGILCEGGGRYRVDGGSLLLGRDARITTVTLSGRQVSLGPAFPPVPITLHSSRRATLVWAHWTRLPGLPRGAQFVGVIDGDTCATLDGVLHVPGRGRAAAFRASLVLCQEGVEECTAEDLGALQFQRWLRRFSPRAFPLRYVPKGALGNAVNALARAPIAFDRWESIGPAPVRVSPDDPTESVSSINSGRVQAIAVDPSTSGHWLIGAVMGGVWETHDAGVTWTPRTDDQPSLAIGAIAFAPGKPSVVYAGTGAYYLSSYPGAGLLKSTDGGATWSLLAAGTFAGLGFGRIQVSPGGSGTLVAATANPAAYDSSQDHTPPANPKPGVYRSTDGGQNWDLELAGDATDLVAAPADFNHQYAALGNQKGSPANGVYRSTDGGQTWTLVNGPWGGKPGGVGEIRLAISPSHPDTLYVSIRDATDGKGKDRHLLGLWKTDSAWAAAPTWLEIAWNGPPNVDYVIGVPNHAITVSPVSPNVVYAGGVSLWKYELGTWQEYGRTQDDIHADQAALAWALPRLLVGNDGGVYSKDELSPAFGPWKHHNTNLAIARLGGGAVHPTAPDRPLGGAWDTGVLQRDPAFGSTWTFLGGRPDITGGDGQGAFFGGSPQHFGTHLWDTVQRTSDDGATIEAVTWNIPNWSVVGYLAVGAIRPCPANENVVLLPAGTLWRTDNFFSAPTGQDVDWVEDGGFTPSPITAVAFAPSDATCATYAFGTKTGQVFLHRPVGGPLVWFNLDPGQQLPGRYVTGLAFSPASADTLYVTFSGFDEGTPGTPGHVFKTTDATSGAPVWTDVSPPVNLPHNVVAVDPASPATVYVGTDIGLWVSVDGASNWAHAGPAAGLPNVPVQDIVVDPCGVTAFTWGRGAFRQAGPFVCP